MNEILLKYGLSTPESQGYTWQATEPAAILEKQNLDFLVLPAEFWVAGPSRTLLNRLPKILKDAGFLFWRVPSHFSERVQLEHTVLRVQGSEFLDEVAAPGTADAKQDRVLVFRFHWQGSAAGRASVVQQPLRYKIADQVYFSVHKLGAADFLRRWFKR